MKRIESPAQFRVGGIYNVVYVGPNTAYARINGKETVRITAIEPQLKSVTLFHRFGNPLNQHIEACECTYGTQSFTECEIFEPSDESEWLKKSVAFATLQEPLEQGLVTMDDIKRIADRHDKSRFIPYMTGPGHGLAGVTCLFNTEDTVPDQPLLQSVFIVWKNWEDLRKDFARLEIIPNGV
jgi:hypothetical protein